jgi:hypothetical protein
MVVSGQREFSRNPSQPFEVFDRAIEFLLKIDRRLPVPRDDVASRIEMSNESEEAVGAPDTQRPGPIVDRNCDIGFEVAETRRHRQKIIWRALNSNPFACLENALRGNDDPRHQALELVRSLFFIPKTNVPKEAHSGDVRHPQITIIRNCEPGRTQWFCDVCWRTR